MECSITGSLLFVHRYRGKEGMKNSKYHVDLGSIVACKKRKMESTKELGNHILIEEAKILSEFQGKETV